jgi:hypothetical protein
MVNMVNPELSGSINISVMGFLRDLLLAVLYNESVQQSGHFQKDSPRSVRNTTGTISSAIS